MSALLLCVDKYIYKKVIKKNKLFLFFNKFLLFLLRTILNNMNLKFRMRRLEKRITLKKISEGTGISIALLSNYETGKINPGLKNIQLIDEFLKSQGV